MCTMLQCGLDWFDILKKSEHMSDRGRFYSLCWHCILKLGRITEVTKFEKVGSIVESAKQVGKRKLSILRTYTFKL